MADRISIRVPADLEGGVYANFVSIWHTAHEFTLDFSTQLPVHVAQPGDTEVPMRVVARVKVPPTVVFDILRAINENLTRFEERFGEINRPGTAEPLPFPDDLDGDQGVADE